MAGDVRVEVVEPEELGRAERSLWSRWTGPGASLDSPFLALDYTLTAAALRPKGRVAVVRRAGEPVAFLPFEWRGRRMLPLAAPMTDYQALIGAGPELPSLAAVVRAAGARSFSFSGLQTGEAVAAVPRTRLRAHLGSGFDAYMQERRARYPNHWRSKERHRRNLERDVGPLEVRLDDQAPEALAWLITHKRTQYRATGQYDIFAHEWPAELLRRLVGARSPDFGGSIATLRAGGRLVSAAYSLRHQACRHYWFPVYDPAFSRYSPGVLLALELLRRLPEEGVETLDFGLDGEDYKRYFADPAGTVWEGSLGVVGQPSAPPDPQHWRARLARRYLVLSACEETLTGLLAASAATACAAARRRLASRP